MYNILRDEKPDYIVHCGDIFHNKTNLSPECVQLVGEFLKNLADIAPTYIIAGNHDTNLSNEKRLDSITPVIQFLNHENLFYLKDSGEKILRDDLALNVLSVFDEQNWTSPTSKDRINIALYHGSIAGVQTDIGYTLEHTDHDISIFDEFDYALVGDIHKTDQIVDRAGRIRYPGSTVQQNHGETNDKGFLIWEIEDKRKFKTRHISIPNPSPYVTVTLNSEGKLEEDLFIPDNAKVRVMSEINLPVETIKKSVEVIKARFNPESVTYVNKAAERTDISEAVNKISVDDLRDIKIQEDLIEEYLKDFKPSQQTLQQVYDLNKKYNTVVESEEDIARNIKWSIKSMEWNNLFNYGVGNKINFERLNGVVSIVGRNYSGKSSIIESLLWTMQNSTSKNIRKNLNIINQNQVKGDGKLELIVDNKLFTIERSAEKYTKKLAGEETQEAKTDVVFSVCDLADEEECREGDNGNLNGLDRNETDKNIRKMFGTIDDFLMTSMSSQMGALQFLNEGSTKRKEILAKFLDLDIFAKKYKLVNDEAAELKSAIKRLEGKDYDAEIESIKTKSAENEELTAAQKNACSEIKELVQKLKNRIQEIDIETASFPKLEVVDIDEANIKLDKLKAEKDKLSKAVEEYNSDILEKEKLLDNANNIISELSIKDLQEKREKISSLERELSHILKQLSDTEREINSKTKEMEILEQVPCGDKFPNCKFLIKANECKSEVPDLIQIGDRAKDKKNELEKQLSDFNKSEVEISIEKYNKVLEKKRTVEVYISDKKLLVEKSINKLIVIDSDIEKLQSKIDECRQHGEIVEKLKVLRKEKIENESLLKTKEKELEKCDQLVVSLYKEKGSFEEKIKSLEETKNELEKLRDQVSAYFLYEKAMHSNGISYDVIKKKLPIINEEIAKVLSNIVNFEVYFEDDGKKLDILIKHPRFEARPIELGSGAEKNLAATAIRLALIKVSSLPKSDIFILDEPATSLDEENLEGFMRIIDMLKGSFKTIILISHLDVLKDVADIQITIDKVDGYAKVNI